MVSDSKPEGHEEPQLRVVDRRWWARKEGDDPVEPSGARKPSYVEDLEKRLAEQAAQLQNYLTEHRRSLDEFEQVKSRIKREVAREVERGKRAVLVEMLEVIDNLDRAISAVRGTTGSDEVSANLIRGVELVRDQFLVKLGAFGVIRTESLGLEFDATRHEAVTTASVADLAQDGVVIAVLKEGYAIGDEILRPASVVVGRARSDS
jgi:molecular chaperone GrpE